MWWCDIYSCWVTHDAYSQSAREETDVPETIEKARRDWVYAKWYFNAVTEPELIDYAIYMIKAAELKYIYLLKKAKQEGVKYSRYLQCENNA
ncbi:MAG: YaaL family protein [Pelosinus sp.]|nr:YaaL family protein [Pelosinus sp.]